VFQDEVMLLMGWLVYQWLLRVRGVSICWGLGLGLCDIGGAGEHAGGKGFRFRLHCTADGL
jgi:hypothetical protein